MSAWLFALGTVTCLGMCVETEWFVDVLVVPLRIQHPSQVKRGGCREGSVCTCACVHPADVVAVPPASPTPTLACAITRSCVILVADTPPGHHVPVPPPPPCQALVCTLDACMAVGDASVLNFDAVRAARKKACAEGMLPLLLRQYCMRMDGTASLTAGV